MSTESKANTPHFSLEGHLLIAAPRMDDPRFARSVVLVLQHTQDGAMGVVLNRPVDQTTDVSDSLAEVFAHIERLHAGRLPVRIGGPVSGPLIALRTPTLRGGKGGVYLVEGRSQLDKLTSQPGGPLQFFIGHSGWHSGQLEEELNSGCWLTLPAAANFLEMEHSQMWLTALRETGRSIYREALGIHGFPQDATLN